MKKSIKRREIVPEVKTPEQLAYDAAMADATTRKSAMKDRAAEMVEDLKKALAKGWFEVRTLGMGGNHVTIPRCDMGRMLAVAKRTAIA